MLIIDKPAIDKTGRINLTNLFVGNPPREVGVAYDTESNTIIIEPWKENSKLIRRKLDDKSRISIKWLLKFTSDNIYIIIDEKGNRKLVVINSPQ